MIKYEELMNKSDDCKMATFWKNASIGFKEKALTTFISD